MKLSRRSLLYGLAIGVLGLVFVLVLLERKVNAAARGEGKPGSKIEPCQPLSA